MIYFLAITFSVAALLYLAVYVYPGAMYQLAMRAERKIARLQTSAINIDGIHYSYTDSQTGVPLLLLHGFSADKDNWTRVARHLTHDFRVIAPDLPGFGDSSSDPTQDYSIDTQVDRIVAFADGLGLKTLHLGGSSMGGTIAAALAARHPKRVLSLWLLAPAGVANTEQSAMEQILHSGAAHPLIPGDREGFEKTLDFVFVKRPFLPGPLRRYLAQDAVDRQSLRQQIFADLLDETGSSMRLTLNTPVTGLNIPTLIVWGADDRVLHPAGAEQLRQLLGNAEVQLLPGVGHLPMLENPRRTATGFLRFQRHVVSANSGSGSGCPE